MISGTFGKPAPVVKEFFDEALKWLTKQGFAGVSERSHRGVVGAYLAKFHNNVQSATDPEKLIMNGRGWLVATPTEVRLHIERVPAQKVDPNALPDAAAIVNHCLSIPFSGLDSIKEFKQEIEKWLL